MDEPENAAEEAEEQRVYDFLEELIANGERQLEALRALNR